MPLNNGKPSQQTNSTPLGFPTGSYKSYKSFLRQYSKPEQDLPTTKITSNGICNKSNANNVRNMVSILDKNFNSNSNSNSTGAISSQATTLNGFDFSDFKYVSNLNHILSMSIEEVQMLNKETLEKFLKIITEYEEKNQNNKLKENGRVDLNNNKITGKFSTVTNSSEITDDDIEKQKQNLIESLKLKLEKCKLN